MIPPRMETQDVSTELLVKFWPWFEANKNRLIGGVAIVVLAGLIYSFIVWHRGQNEINAGEAMTQFLFSPSIISLTPNQQADGLVKLADQYSGTETAKRALLQAGSTLFMAGDYPGAQTQFQKLVDTYAGPLSGIAQLGVATSLDAQGKTDQAQTAYLKVTSSYNGSPADMRAEFALGRMSEQQGKLQEAESYYESAARAGQLGGTLAQEAEGRAYQIKMQLAAKQKTAAGSTTPTITPSLIKK
jgi:predicted negative regulator of RcsB-dependent stress response